MSTGMLCSLDSEVKSISNVGNSSIKGLLKESGDFLEDLKDIEASLLREIDNEQEEKSLTNTLEEKTGQWYKTSISYLKQYNSGINSFQKNTLNNPKFNIDLDEAYTYPLNLSNYPVKLHPGDVDLLPESELSLKKVHSEGHQELLKAIILHLLKMGQCDMVKDIMQEFNSDLVIDEELLPKFKLLNEIVDDIVTKHDLSRALKWFRDRYNSSTGAMSLSNNSSGSSNSLNEEIEFKFHVLQFTLLLNDGSGFSLNNALEAYLYSKENFPRFFVDYLYEISPLLTLLLLETSKDDDDYARKNMINLLSEFSMKLKLSFKMEQENNNRVNGGSLFVGELLANFNHIHSNQAIFVNLSNELISEYCKDMKLSNDSSLFQVVLAGLVNLPSFYKFNKIQLKLNKVKTTNTIGSDPLNAEADYRYDMPFHLPDSNRFLFKYHPIFICPISKEQLVPVTDTKDYISYDGHGNKKKKKLSNDALSGAAQNTVVVLNFCQHLALKESVWQISKKGTDIFNCHYCYKKHKFSDVSDAYFIDL